VSIRLRKNRVFGRRLTRSAKSGSDFGIPWLHRWPDYVLVIKILNIIRAILAPRQVLSGVIQTQSNTMAKSGQALRENPVQLSIPPAESLACIYLVRGCSKPLPFPLHSSVGEMEEIYMGNI